MLAQRANDGNEHPGSQIIDEENEENENTVRNGATAAMASDIGHRGASAKRIRRRLGDSVGKLICEVFTDEY
ncbi:hypothetical protein EON65_12455 [archaeon]|nr:MAG: hypothetical protein EON65_12455 [archaeon]